MNWLNCWWTDGSTPWPIFIICGLGNRPPKAMPTNAPSNTSLVNIFFVHVDSEVRRWFGGNENVSSAPLIIYCRRHVVSVSAGLTQCCSGSVPCVLYVQGGAKVRRRSVIRIFFCEYFRRYRCKITRKLQVCSQHSYITAVYFIYIF